MGSTQEGFVVLGTPVGSDEFIASHLAKEVQQVLMVLSRIKSVDALGKLNSKWATPQGLYVMLRDFVNQLLRHLLRAVDPRLTKEAFQEVDEETLAVVEEILGLELVSESFD